MKDSAGGTIKNKAAYPLVYIEWDDSRQPNGQWKWISDFKEAKAAKCISVGFLIPSNKHVKVLAPNMADIGDEEAQAAGTIQIPAKCITRIIKLKKP